MSRTRVKSFYVPAFSVFAAEDDEEEEEEDNGNSNNSQEETEQQLRQLVRQRIAAASERHKQNPPVVVVPEVASPACSSNAASSSSSSAGVPFHIQSGQSSISDAANVPASEEISRDCGDDTRAQGKMADFVSKDPRYLSEASNSSAQQQQQQQQQYDHDLLQIDIAFIEQSKRAPTRSPNHPPIEKEPISIGTSNDILMKDNSTLQTIHQSPEQRPMSTKPQSDSRTSPSSPPPSPPPSSNDANPSLDTKIQGISYLLYRIERFGKVVSVLSHDRTLLTRQAGDDVDAAALIEANNRTPPTESKEVKATHNSRHNLQLFRPERSGTLIGPITMVSMEELLQWCLLEINGRQCSFNDREFTRFFVFCLESFGPNLVSVFAEIGGRFHEFLREERSSQKRKKIFKRYSRFIMEWAWDGGPSRFENKLVIDQILMTLQRLCESGSHLVELRSLLKLCRKYSALIEKKMQFDIERESQVPLPAPSSPPPIDVCRLEPLDLAVQLSLIEYELFLGIESAEFFDLAWTKGKAPHISAIIDRFNTVSLWVAHSILKLTDPDERREMIRRFIVTAKYCMSIKNFNGVFSVMTALNCTPIQRLQRSTWKALNADLVDKFDELQELCNLASNHRNYRTALASAKPPFLPYLGVHLKDLVGIEEQQQLKDAKGFLNLTKRERMVAIFRYVLPSKSRPYPFRIDPQIRFHLLHSLPRDLSDKKLMQLSKEIEPPRQSKKRTLFVASSE